MEKQKKKKHPREIQELIDAISGATWETRNRIMEERFQQRLADSSQNKVPKFYPPGKS